jgi:hypothetical protein
MARAACAGVMPGPPLPIKVDVSSTVTPQPSALCARRCTQAMVAWRTVSVSRCSLSLPSSPSPTTTTRCGCGRLRGLSGATCWLMNSWCVPISSGYRPASSEWRMAWPSARSATASLPASAIDTEWPTISVVRTKLRLLLSTVTLSGSKASRAPASGAGAPLSSAWLGCEGGRSEPMPREGRLRMRPCALPSAGDAAGTPGRPPAGSSPGS